MAIDRVKVYDSASTAIRRPPDTVGLNYLFPSWVTDSSVKAEAKKLSTYDPAAAEKMFTDDGLECNSNKLLDPKRATPSPSRYHVISGWSDWVTSLQIISKTLQDVGINTSVKLEPDWGSWYPNATSTKFVTLLLADRVHRLASTATSSTTCTNNTVGSPPVRTLSTPASSPTRRTGRRRPFSTGRRGRLTSTGRRRWQTQVQKTLAEGAANHATVASVRSGPRTAPSTSTASRPRTTGMRIRISTATRTTQSR